MLNSERGLFTDYQELAHQQQHELGVVAAV
jgi:hypothetical protein